MESENHFKHGDLNLNYFYLKDKLSLREKR